MARVISNDFVKGISGIIGEDLCFRQIGGRTFVVKRPRKRTTCTENQRKQRDRFNEAVFYTRTVLEDPVKREAYTQQAKEANIRTAYLAAMQDAMRNPEITAIYTESYHGQAGDPIVIAAAKPYKITEASVTIENADGTEVEKGQAVRYGGAWVYKAQAHNDGIDSIITVTVKDRLRKVDVKRISVKSG